MNDHQELAPADGVFAARVERVLGGDVLSDIGPSYLEEPRGILKAKGGLLARPRTAREISQLLKAASQARVGVVPYGGGTGLVGGQLLPNGPPPLVLSLERMRAIRSVHLSEKTMIVEAGATLADAQNAAAEVGLLYPLSLASEGSARVGGTLATNAGGTGVLRYGTARDLCLGIEAVLPDGQIWNGLKRLRKDNTGYDLRNLLIGSEGTLGVITAAVLKLVSRPAATGTAMLAVDSPEAALKLLAMAQDRFGEMVSAFEIMHRQGFDFLREKLPAVRLPFATSPEWTVLIELGLIAGMSPPEALEGLFADALEAALVSDGLVAQSQGQAAEFWAVRERIPEANRLIGAISSHDISLPLSAVSEFLSKAERTLARKGAFRINCFGHLGDGNLHYNVFPPEGASREVYKNQRDGIKSAVHDVVHDLGGSFSAEHGVGRLKRNDLERYGDPTKLTAMRAIKAALDPNGIMNPGAVLE